MAGDELLRGRLEDGASAGKGFGAVAVFRIGEEWGFVAPVRPASIATPSERIEREEEAAGPSWRRGQRSPSR